MSGKADVTVIYVNRLSRYFQNVSLALDQKGNQYGACKVFTLVV